MSTDTGFSAGGDISNDFVAPQQPIASEQQQADYFGFGGSERFTFPDGLTWVEFKIMNEGAKSRFQSAVQRDLIIERSSGNARTSVDPAVERHQLIEASLTAWNLKTRRTAGGPLEDVAFNAEGRRKFLTNLDPKIIEELEKDIRKANPWLRNELSVADIDEQIDQLQDAREEARKREEGEDSSSNK